VSLENRVVTVSRRLILHVTHIDSEVGVVGAILKALIFCRCHTGIGEGINLRIASQP
jgi:hypothetical protein